MLVILVVASITYTWERSSPSPIYTISNPSPYTLDPPPFLVLLLLGQNLRWAIETWPSAYYRSIPHARYATAGITSFNLRKSRVYTPPAVSCLVYNMANTGMVYPEQHAIGRPQSNPPCATTTTTRLPGSGILSVLPQQTQPRGTHPPDPLRHLIHPSLPNLSRPPTAAAAETRRQCCSGLGDAQPRAHHVFCNMYIYT